MAVRSRRLASVVCPVAANTIVYTVPAGRTAVVRNIVLSNQSTTVATTATLLLNGTSASSNGLRRGLSLPANTYLELEHWLALNPGDVLRVSTGAGAGVLAHVFGALLLGEPE